MQKPDFWKIFKFLKIFVVEISCYNSVLSSFSPLHAVGFASLVGITGVSTLYHLVNPLSAGIAAATLFLYVSAYTPLKRVSIVNTWMGAVVGALPPMIGWAACTGGLDYGEWLNIYPDITVWYSVFVSVTLYPRRQVFHKL